MLLSETAWQEFSLLCLSRYTETHTQAFTTTLTTALSTTDVSKQVFFTSTLNSKPANTCRQDLSSVLCKRVQPNRNFATEALTLILIWPKKPHCSRTQHARLLLIFLLCCSPRHSPAAAHSIASYILVPTEFQQIIPWDPPSATVDLWQIQVFELLNGTNQCTLWSRLKLSDPS